MLFSEPMSEQYNHVLKLDRALQHLQSLEDEMLRWLGRNPYRLIYEFDRERNKKLIRIEVLSPPPSGLRVIIGDILHNLRSALDTLVHELAVAYIGIDPLPEAFARRLEFPIFGDRTMKPHECRTKIGGIHPDAQAIIKELQPYHRAEDFARDPLWLLHRLSNLDPHLTLFRPESISSWTTGQIILSEGIEHEFGPIEDSNVVTRYPHLDDTGAEINVQFHYTFSVGFSQKPPNPPTTASAPANLRWTHRHIVDEVLPPLVPYLTEIPIVRVRQPYCLLRDKSEHS
jgi:hypothetical protein